MSDGDSVAVGWLLPSDEVTVTAINTESATTAHLTRDEATELANALTDAVDQLDGREMRQCTWRSPSSDDAYCQCTKYAGHTDEHQCAHGLDHNATGRDLSNS